MTATMTRPQPLAASAENGITFGRLFRVEWTKATDTRSARWLIGLTGLVTIAIMLAPLLAPTKIDQTWKNYLGFSSFALTTLMPVVAVMTMTSEWTQRTVMTTFTQEPRRTRVVWAKVAVSLAMAVAATLFGAIVTAGSVGIANGVGRDITDQLTAKMAVGFLLFVAIQVLMGAAFGAVLHNTAAAIVLVFVLPVVLGFLGNAFSSIGKWIDPGTTFQWLVDGTWGGQHAAGILLCLVVWVLLPLAAGVVRTVRREIK